MAESGHWLTVNMHAYARYANDCLWPKADIETESKWVFLNVRFGEKSRHSSTVNMCVSPESASGNFSPARGTVLLSQLTESLRAMSLPVERGLYFLDTTLGDVLRSCNKNRPNPPSFMSERETSARCVVYDH